MHALNSSTHNICERMPADLEDEIFHRGAKYDPMISWSTTLDFDEDKIKVYLGTYFPRSYVEPVTHSLGLVEKARDWKGALYFEDCTTHMHNEASGRIYNQCKTGMSAT